MNICMHATVKAGFDVIKAKIEKDMAGNMGKFCTDYRLANLGNGEIIFIGNITDMEALGAMMSSPEEVQWDIDNGAEYKAYLMNEMTG